MRCNILKKALSRIFNVNNQERVPNLECVLNQEHVLNHIKLTSHWENGDISNIMVDKSFVKTKNSK